MQLLHSLLEQLGEDPRTVHFHRSSPVHRKVIELRLTDSSPLKHTTGRLQTQTVVNYCLRTLTRHSLNSLHDLLNSIIGWLECRVNTCPLGTHVTPIL